MESNGDERVDQASTGNQIGDLNERWTGVEKLAVAGSVAPSAADKPIWATLSLATHLRRSLPPVDFPVHPALFSFNPL